MESKHIEINADKLEEASQYHKYMKYTMDPGDLGSDTKQYCTNGVSNTAGKQIQKSGEG